MKTDSRSHLFILALLIICHIWINHLIVINSSPLWEDATAYQAMEAKQHSDAIHNFGIWKSAVQAMDIQMHPQLYQFLVGIAASRHPPESRDSLYHPIEIVNGLFLCILIFTVYGIGKQIYGPAQGLLSAILISFCPVVFGQLRLPMLESPLAAMTSLFVYLLLKSRAFQSLPASLLAGIAMGLAQLTKETALIFTLPVFLTYSLQALTASGAGKKDRLLNCLLAAAAAFSLAAPVYLNPANHPIYSGYWYHFAKPNHPGLLFYLKALRPYYLGWLLFLPALPLIASFVIHIRKREPILTPWLVLPFIIFTFTGVKAVRFLIPALPPLFMILTNEAFQIFPRRLKIVYPALFTAVAALQFAYLTFFLPEKHLIYKPCMSNETGLLTITHSPLVSAAENLAVTIKNDANIVCLLEFNYWNYLQLLLKLQGKSLHYAQLRSPFNHDMTKWKKQCADSDYMLELSDCTGCGFVDSQTYIKFREACLPFFGPSQEFPCGQRNESTRVLLYKRKPLTGKFSSPGGNSDKIQD